jgi:hypothetical protein
LQTNLFALGFWRVCGLAIVFKEMREQKRSRGNRNTYTLSLISGLEHDAFVEPRASGNRIS